MIKARSTKVKKTRLITDLMLVTNLPETASTTKIYNSLSILSLGGVTSSHFVLSPSSRWGSCLLSTSTYGVLNLHLPMISAEGVVTRSSLSSHEKVWSVIVFGSTNHQVEIGSLDRVAVKCSIQYPNSPMEALKGETGPFMEVVDRHLMKFGEDTNGKRRELPKILLCRLLGMQLVCSCHLC